MKIEKIRYSAHHYIRIGSPFLKVLAPLRSGSNFLEKSMYKNYFVRIAKPYMFCWKHQYPSTSVDCKKIIIMREPVSWCISFYNWEIIHGRADRQMGILNFVKANLNQPDIIKYIGKLTPYEYWNTFLEDALAVKDEISICTYDGLIENYAKTISKLGVDNRLFKLRPTIKKFNIKADWWVKPNKAPKLTESEKQQFKESLKKENPGFDLSLWEDYKQASNNRLS